MILREGLIGLGSVRPGKAHLRGEPPDSPCVAAGGRTTQGFIGGDVAEFLAGVDVAHNAAGRKEPRGSGHDAGSPRAGRKGAGDYRRTRVSVPASTLPGSVATRTNDAPEGSAYTLKFAELSPRWNDAFPLQSLLML